MRIVILFKIDPANPSECWLSQMVCKALWLHKEESYTKGSLVFREISDLLTFWNSSEPTSLRRQQGLGAVEAEGRENSSQKDWVLGSQGWGWGTPPSSFPRAWTELSLTCHSSCASPEWAGITSLNYSRPPAQAAASWDRANLSSPPPLPWLASAAKDSRPQDTELLICEESGCWRCWYNNQAVSSSAWARHWCVPVK